MGYSNFKKLRTVTKKFGLTTTWGVLFKEFENVNPSVWLKETLEMAQLFPLINEKTKSERVVSPILMEVSKIYKDKISFFSGEDLNIKAEDDLSGECDFFFVLAPRKPYLENPIISISAQKFISESIAQCAAQLYGAKLFNEVEGTKFPILYGCATNGVKWQFMRFENNVFYIDSKIYTDIKEILGVWHHIIQFYVGKKE